MALITYTLSQNKRIFGLDLIRFIAIISVLYCHFSVLFYPYLSGKAEVLYNLSYWVSGYFGVELFFVLSGFLIGGIFIKTIVNHPQKGEIPFSQIKEFWLRRWIRTLPNYLLFLILNILFIPICNVDFNLSVFVNYLLFLQGSLGLNNSSFFSESWSLAVEEWFYLLMPIFFLAAFFINKNKKFSFWAAVSCLIIAPILLKFSYAYDQSFMASNYYRVFRFGTFYRLDAIGYGVLFSMIWTTDSIKQILLKYKNFLFLIGIFLLIGNFAYIFFFLTKNEQNPILFLALSTFSCISILFCFPAIIEFKVSPTSLSYRIVVWVSLISYSLYLSNRLVMHILEYCFPEFYNYKNIFISTLYVLCLLSISLICSSIIYKYFEKPIMNKRENIIKFLKIK